MDKLGSLFIESHASLRDDFEVTNDALNQIVEAARAHPACYGARMTGAGFGGCAVALVDAKRVDVFINGVKEDFRGRSGLEAQFYVSPPSEGARTVQLTISD